MFRNAEYIYAVYKTGSFSAAAKSLYVTQPCLSAMVKKTEQMLGVPLFDRNSKPLQLTEYGQRYIAYIEKVWELEHEMEQYLSDVRGLRAGELSIGTNNVFASYVLPPLIRRFNSRYPGVKVQMVEGSISYLEQALIQGSVDLVLDNCPMNENHCVQHQLGTELLLAAVPEAVCPEGVKRYLTHQDIRNGLHLAKNAPVLQPQAMASVPVIALRKGNDTRIRMDAICQEAGVAPRLQLEVDQLATAYNIACNGLGMTLVSDTLLRSTMAFPEVRYFKLESSLAERPVYLYHKRARYVTRAMQAFLDTAKAELSVNNLI